MIGYKAFDKNLQCRGFQYKIGQIYEISQLPIICERGFHFCKDIASLYNFYPPNFDTRVCQIEALGDIDSFNDSREIKYCTNKIKILEEITDYRKFCNTDSKSIGYFNLGYNNYGFYNLGNYNKGKCNKGDYNYGDYNLDSFNIGHCNTGSRNIGDHNIGYYNTGNYNKGYCNKGNYNVGDFNVGNFCEGVFNTSQNNNKKTIKMFNKDSNWTYEDWKSSAAYRILCNYPFTTYFKTVFTEKEFENHPEISAIGGFTAERKLSQEQKQKWWDRLFPYEKHEIMSLPNFDKDIFEQCMDIKIKEEDLKYESNSNWK
jgi:hypothetical protein